MTLCSVFALSNQRGKANCWGNIIPWRIYAGASVTTQGILYLVILNRADFSTQVLSVVLPHIPAGSKSKVKSHTEPCCLVSIPFGRISTFFGYLQFMLYVSLSGPFAPDSLLIDCYAHRLEVQLWVVQSNALFSVIKSKTIPVHVEETINFQLKALEFTQLKLCV